MRRPTTFWRLPLDLGGDPNDVVDYTLQQVAVAFRNHEQSMPTVQRPRPLIGATSPTAANEREEAALPRRCDA